MGSGSSTESQQHQPKHPAAVDDMATTYDQRPASSVSRQPAMNHSHTPSFAQSQASPPPTSPLPPIPSQQRQQPIAPMAAVVAPEIPIPAIPTAETNMAAAETKSQQGSQRGRRGSFSFLRRSKSKSDKEPTAPSVGRKLTRNRKGKRDASLEAAATDEPVPRLSSALLPQEGAPAPDFTSNPGFAAARFPPSSFKTNHNPANTSYDPSAFYSRHRMDASHNSQSVRSPSAAAAAVSPPPDPYARTESMTNRGRYSYASSAVSNVNSPRRVRRRKDPTPFNVLVVGSKNSGKTSFIEFLRKALAQPSRHLASHDSPPGTVTHSDPGSPFTSHYLETEMEGERIGLTLYDSKGLERHIVDLQLREMSSFLESKFQETFNEEQKVLRAPGVKDTHIHCVFLVLDPARLDGNIAASSPTIGPQKFRGAAKQRVFGGLDEDLDVELLRKLQGKTTVIPIISKADTVTTAHMAHLKRTVWDSLKKLRMDPLEVLNLDTEEDDDDDDSEYDTASSILNREPDTDEYDSDAIDDLRRKGQTNDVVRNGSPSKKMDFPTLDTSKPPQHGDIRISTLSENVDLPHLPLSIISPDSWEPGTVGRRFPWGFADPYNAEHCDFVKLKDSVFGEWRSDLRTAAQERWYEGWRTTRLRKRTNPTAAPPLRNTTNGRDQPPRAVSSGGPSHAHHASTLNVRTSPTLNRAASASEIGIAVSKPAPMPPMPSQQPQVVPGAFS